MCPFVTGVVRSSAGIFWIMPRFVIQVIKKNNSLESRHFLTPMKHIYLWILGGGFILERAALGKRIRESRIAKGYTQQDLADRAEIGVVYLSEIERGIKMPSINIFVRIIEALEVSADYVLRDELPSGKEYICAEISEKLLVLTPRQRKTATAILDAYLSSLL